MAMQRSACLTVLLANYMGATTAAETSLTSSHMAPKRLGSLNASSFFTRSLPGGRYECTQPAREGGHRMKGTRPSISAKGTCSPAAPASHRQPNCSARGHC